jgi:hypothetical protein
MEQQCESQKYEAQAQKREAQAQKREAQKREAQKREAQKREARFFEQTKVPARDSRGRFTRVPEGMRADVYAWLCGK